MIFAVIHIFKMTNWKKIFLHDTFVYWFFTLSLSPIWIGWHVWKMWHIIKFHFHMRPFQQRKKRIRYYLGKRARGDRELQTHFSHIAVALVMARGQNMETRNVFHCAEKVSKPSYQVRLFFSGKHDHLIIQQSLPFFLQSYPAEMYLTLTTKCDKKYV